MTDDEAAGSGKDPVDEDLGADVADIFTRVRSGDRAALAGAITLIESTKASDRRVAMELIDRCFTFAGGSIRLGVSGLPGAGKSTLIDRLGCLAADEGHRVAVLTIDPSSERSGGSILGDKTRMENLTRREGAFVRPSASRGSLGGVGSRTRESILLCEAAGYDVVIVETVGVGQSEAEVSRLVDLVILMVTTGGGDELQSIKRGVIEFADIIIVSKADGRNLEPARETAAMYRNAVELFPRGPSGWRTSVRAVSSLDAADIAAVWATVNAFFTAAHDSGRIQENRSTQASDWLRTAIREEIQWRLLCSDHVLQLIDDHERRIRSGRETPPAAAARIVDEVLERNRSKE